MSGDWSEAANRILKQPLIFSALFTLAAAAFLIADGLTWLPDYEGHTSLGRLVSTWVLLIATSALIVFGTARLAPLVKSWVVARDVQSKLKKLDGESAVIVRETLVHGQNYIWISLEHPGIEPLRRLGLARVDDRVFWATKVVFIDHVWATMMRNYDSYSTLSIPDAVLTVHQKALQDARWTLENGEHGENARSARA